MSRPYKLQVVLRFSDHRDLTEVLKEKVERELRDNLRAGFGDLVQVEVSRTHPRLKEIEEKGLQSLDTWKDVNGFKTHFVFVDYADNTFYEIRARQHDGYTGQASPVIRQDRTNSRDFLARQIGFVLDLDFGFVGELTNPGDQNTVEVTLKGAGPDVLLSRWIKAGDVFNLVEVAGAGELRSKSVPFAILQAQDAPNKNGVLKCRFYHRHKDPFKATPGSKGFRCMKLATIKAPIRLRLVQYGAKTPTGLIGWPVYVRRQGFDKESKEDQNATDSDGFTKLLGKARPFENIAFVVINNPANAEKANQPAARVPIPILDDRPVVIALDVKKEAATPLELRQRFWVRRINDRLVENQGLFADLNKDAAQAGKLGDTMERAKKARVGLQEDIYNLGREGTELKEAADATPEAKVDLDEGDKRIALLKKDLEALENFIDGQEKIVQKENDPARREFKAKWEQAKALEREKEYDRAIKLYEEAQQGLQDPGLGAYLDKLKAAWKPKSEAHEQARAFIYGQWPEFDADRMKEQIAKARAAFETCQKAGDNLTPQKLLRVALSHDGKLKEILEGLDPGVNLDQKQPYENALAATADLAQLMKDITRFLKESLGEK
jgi:hypothetical protein